MAQTNQPMGSSPLANMQAQLGANMLPGQAMPAGWQNQMLAGRAMMPGATGLGTPATGAAQPVTPNPQLGGLMAGQMGGLMGGQQPQVAGGRPMMRPGRLNTMQPMPLQGATPPMGAPGRGAAPGKGAGNPAQMQAMKQQIARLPGAPGAATPR